MSWPAWSLSSADQASPVCALCLTLAPVRGDIYCYRCALAVDRGEEEAAELSCADPWTATEGADRAEARFYGALLAG